jgi:hypothetical protein
MKKLLLVLVAIIGFGVSVTADDLKTCKVEGGSVEVNAIITDADKGTVTVNVMNDSGNNVNVRYTVKVYFVGGETELYPRATLAKANLCADPITINTGRKVTAVVITEVKGEKCK